MQTRPLVLASASPRRRELLTRLGLTFEVESADILEARRPGEAPPAYVARLAEEKVRAVADRSALARGTARFDSALARGTARFDRGGTVAFLGADTTVVLGDEVLEKPADLAESERMLRALRGREHVVYTAVALLLEPEAKLKTVVVRTRVRFRDFGEATLRGYVASREGMDKAGAYGIQDLGAGLVLEVHGSYTNVVGLPAAETIALLEEQGALASWPGAGAP